jgi:hypothetical protein
MKRVTILLLLAALAIPVAAAEKEGGDAKKGGKPGTNVDMPFLMAPMTNADGKLSGYAYLSSRLTATSDANALAVRDKLAFIQDAMVRDINTASVTSTDPEMVDIPAVEQRLLADAAKVMGAGKVKLITICTVQVASLHPVQTPAKVTPDAVPGAPAPKNPEKSRCES